MFDLERDHRIGVIDIGSNSIRLVVYDEMKRAPTALYNEKVICQLGRGLALTGKLNPNGVALAQQAIARFLAMARTMEVIELYVIATAAVRDATDGLEFVRALEQRHNISIEIISGKKEARLGAYGICASVHKPEGITGDLGGGSMEFVLLDDQVLKEQTTLPIGSLRLIDETGGDREKIRRLVQKQLNEVDWLKRKKLKNFYAIGGSFRALAKMHMVLVNHPLRVLHEYTVSSKQFVTFLRDILRLPDMDIAEYPGASAKRIDVLPAAAIVLEQVIETTRPDQIIFSASGIREGYLYEKLSPYMREQDVLLASSTDVASRTGRSTAYANELFVWMFPLFEQEKEEDRRLRLAFCMFSEIACYIHPEHRAEWAMQRVLQSSLVGLTHAERMQLALAMYYRYQFRLKDEPDAIELISSKEKKWAKLVGTAGNLAYHLTGGIPGNLHKTALSIEKGSIVLTLAAGASDLMGDAVKKRVIGVQEVWRELMG